MESFVPLVLVEFNQQEAPVGDPGWERRGLSIVFVPSLLSDALPWLFVTLCLKP